jgi:hypothetical protein
MGRLRRMLGIQRLGLALAGLLVAGLGSFGLAPAASATPGQVIHNVDVTGAVFSCGATTYTIVSGTATVLFHESTDASGGMHVTGTIAPKNVTLESSADGTYRLAGASWFGGNVSASGSADFTDTEHFVILGSSGGVVANVQIVAHFTQNANGTVTVEFEKNTGTCVPPEE